MKNIFTLIFTCFCNILYSQNYSDINIELGIPDSLTSNRRELRIYQEIPLMRTVEVVQIYEDTLKNWVFNHFQYLRKYGDLEKPATKKHILTSKNNSDSIWCGIVQSNVFNLPNMSDIEYKLKTYDILKDSTGKFKLAFNEMRFYDGNQYFIQAKWNKELNEVFYVNPEIFLTYFPEVDELIYFSQLLNVIREEFNVLKIN